MMTTNQPDHTPPQFKTTETFPQERIDAICSLNPTQLFKALYGSLEEARRANADRLKISVEQCKYSKTECMEYLKSIIYNCKLVQANGYKYSVDYRYAVNTPTYGRKYTRNFGIQRLERKLRGFLTGDLYTDLDMKNAHPCILRNLIKLHCPTHRTPLLDSYCSARDCFLREYGVNKTDMLIALNKVKGKKDDPELIKNFINELNPVREFFWNKHPELQATAKKGWNVKSSLLNKLMCIEENRLLEKAINHLGIINPVRMFDGFMPPNSELPPNAIETLNALTLEEGIIWDVKEPESFTFPEDVTIKPKPPKKCNIDVGAILASDPRSYESVKNKFEKTRFVCLTPCCYVTEQVKNGERVIERVNKTDFFNKNEPLTYIYTDLETGEEFVRPFMTAWFKDPNRREYDCIDFIPPPSTCPDTTFNLYTGLAYENIAVEPDDDIQVILDHLRFLSGEEETDKIYNYQLCWFAHMLQKPGVMPRTAILWNSIQGMGKNIFSDGFGNLIIGTKSFISTEDADQFVGKWRNVSDKFFGVYNEASSRDTHGLDGKIKALITEPVLSWEAKGKDCIMVNNFIRMLFLTNKDNGVKIESGGQERRFQVIQITGKRPNQEYFDAIVEFWKSPARVLGFANYLLKVDLSKWDSMNDRVETEFCKAMKSINIPTRDKWLAHFLENDLAKEMLGYRWKPAELYKLYCKFMKEMTWKPETSTMFGRKLKEARWKGIIEPVFSGKSCRYYKINKVALKRKLIEENIIDEEMLGSESDDDDYDVELE